MSQQQQLAHLLKQRGYIDDDGITRAMEEHQRTGGSFARTLVGLDLVTHANILEVLATASGFEYATIDPNAIDIRLLELVPEHLATKHVVMPLRADDDGTVVIATHSPPDAAKAKEDIQFATGRRVKLVVSPREEIEAAHGRYAASGDAVNQVAEEIGGEEQAEEDPLGSAIDSTDEAPIVRFVNAIIGQAVADGASDIHIEPQEKELRVRERVDGVLHLVTTQHRKVLPGIVSRLKIMGDMDIAERRIPQDGRIKTNAGNKQVDLRVSTLPSVFGEKVVMRILDKSSIMLDLSDLGFATENYQRYEHSFRKPYGMILVTGPTGSGKSTTLYATLNAINDLGVNIITTEDPVEYQLSGITQVQIDTKAGLTFPSALRSILRQDPDIVLVGEMRDQETAKIGMEAALTGHLVLSTLHTNDAPSAVTRLTEMGVDPFLVSSAVDCVLAQRLARRLCKKCKQSDSATVDELTAAGLDPSSFSEAPTVYRANGCSACANTGYKGRLAVHEVMSVTTPINDAIIGGKDSDEIMRIAREEGMATLREDGIAKILEGLTTFEEISRVVA